MAGSESDGAAPGQLDLVAAALRADAADVATFFEVLVGKLAGSLGERVEVVSEKGLLHRAGKPRRVAVRLGDASFEAERDRDRVVCRVRHVVRGVVLRTDEVALDEWLGALARALVEEASKSASARAALEALLT
jgi:hypothetical protein